LSKIFSQSINKNFKIMSSGTAAAANNENDKSIEMQHLMNDLEHGKDLAVKKVEGLVHEQTSKLDERVNVKLLYRSWGPTFELIVRLMLVSCFLDDSLGIMMQFPAQVASVGGSIFATSVLSAGLVAQIFGSVCLILLKYPDSATKALISWTVVQPILYKQVLNLEFVAESISLIGGLMMMRAHLVHDDARSHTQLIGRLLLPAMYIFYAGQFFFEAFTFDETSSVAMFISDLSLFVLNFAALIALLVSCTLVSVGLQSRIIALLLAIGNIAWAFYNHPFFLYAYRAEGEWKLRDMPMPNVELAEGVTLSSDDLWEVYGLHAYYFFLGLSTSGALLLLTQLGPGEIAVQKNEVIIPTRAID